MHHHDTRPGTWVVVVEGGLGGCRCATSCYRERNAVVPLLFKLQEKKLHSECNGRFESGRQRRYTVHPTSREQRRDRPCNPIEAGRILACVEGRLGREQKIWRGTTKIFFTSLHPYAWHGGIMPTQPVTYLEGIRFNPVVGRVESVRG